MINLNRIMVPIDFSEHSDNALRYGCELAEKFGAELLLLHIVEPLPAAYMDGPYFPQDSIVEQIDIGKMRLTNMPTPELAGGIKIKRKTIHGHPSVKIVEVAKSEDVGLIVMGTHGRSGFAHFFIGSVAERVVRQANCPVLTVHHPEHEFVTTESASEAVCSL